MTPRAPDRLADAARALDEFAALLDRRQVRSHQRVIRELADRAAGPVSSDQEAEQRLTDLHAQLLAMADHKEGLDDLFFADPAENRELDRLRDAAKTLTEPTGRPRLRKHR